MPTPGPVATALSVLEARQGTEHLLIEELRSLVRASRKEAGCLVFDLYRIAGRPSAFALHEVWEPHQAIEAHASNFHTTRFRMTVERYLASPIEVFELEELI
jgi:quinol monooxygenase YgiN